MLFYSLRNQMRRFSPGKLFFVQILAAGALSGTGDVICQKVIEKKAAWDPIRTSRFVLATSMLIAPFQFYWFRFLERKIVAKTPIQSTSVRERFAVSLKRVAVDQSFAAPFLTATFILSVNLMDSFSIDHAVKSTNRIYLDVMKSSYKYWPFVQMVNLTIVPMNYRVVFLQFFAIFWNIYLSFKSNN